jgi:hypothetical protein
MTPVMVSIRKFTVVNWQNSEKIQVFLTEQKRTTQFSHHVKVSPRLALALAIV